MPFGLLIRKLGLLNEINVEKQKKNRLFFDFCIAILI